MRDKYVTVVAFGDSITALNHTSHGALNWVGYLTMGLCSTGADIFPHGSTVINSGIGGDSMAKGLARIDRDVLRFDPDIAILSFGTNDSNGTTPSTFKNELREAIRKIRAHNPCTIVLRTPIPRINMLDGRELTEWLENGRIVKNDIASFAQVVRDTAKLDKTVLIDHYSMWIKSTSSSCRGDLIRIMSDPTHPNNFGHRRLYHEIAPTFNTPLHFYYEWERLLKDERSY